MSFLDGRLGRIGSLPRFALELLVIFVGVTSAFVVENYRESLQEDQELRQALAGIDTELRRYAERAVEHADSIDADIARWTAADEAGLLAVPGNFRFPGGEYPPSAAWQTAVAAGTVNLLEPALRIDLGYFYSEFVGIHEKWVRYCEFTEREILPRALLGPSAFYDTAGRLLPEFQVHMDLLAEFAADMRSLSDWAVRLRGQIADERGSR